MGIELDELRKEIGKREGKIGRSQIVSTFGIGSIYELRKFGGGKSTLHSVMVMGQEYWPKYLQPLFEEDLQSFLGVKCFKVPPGDDDRKTESQLKNIFTPAVRFPKWMVCEKCNRLGTVPREFQDPKFSGPKCNACGAKGIPARLITTCYDKDDNYHPGHIHDFPWNWWAHSNSGRKPCKPPQLKLEVIDGKAGLAGLYVKCVSGECKGKVGRSLADVFYDSALSERNIGCDGSRPWLGDREEGCKRKVRTLLRGASNVYFPVNASAISIPPASEELRTVIQNYFSGDVLALENESDIEASMIKKIKNFIYGGHQKYTDDHIKKAICRIAGLERIDRRVTEAERLTEERAAIISGSDSDGEGKTEDEFLTIPYSQDRLPAVLGEYLNYLVKVTRLREVRALRGFTRVDPLWGSDSYNVKCAPISKEKRDWLPAIEVRGEGIYLEFAPNLIENWEKLPSVKKRIQILQDRYAKKEEAFTGKVINDRSIPSARFVLIHTLSHIIIKQLSLECGYSSASLNERLYVSDDADGNIWAGVLIYTSSPGADGTLGGLVRQAEPKLFERIFIDAIKGARWCSSDPLCVESQGQGTYALNLAACHACCLISETSCRKQNLFLDRGFLIGSLEEPDIAFFKNTAIFE